ncbi:hypothetical protein TNCV_462021 [Trichonephila clavipes]|uniref:Uncharacterized protein n=1 Tax=Trichonephila clavipes TaxID=2585209 RepID=A0A8X6UWD8_TRICX|nr:hypothetical protein TNCV_462021 [Trichonephila clavipes]
MSAVLHPPPSIPLFTRKRGSSTYILPEKYKTEREKCFETFHPSWTHPIDAFPEHISTTVGPVTLPEKPDALENTPRPVEKSRSTAQKYRQEDNLHLWQHVFFCQKRLYLWLRTVKSGGIHFIQTMHVPMLIYELPASSLKCPAQPNVIRRNFDPYDQILYHRMILEPHTAYPIPAGTNYIVLMVQKTAFGWDTIP